MGEHLLCHSPYPRVIHPSACVNLIDGLAQGTGSPALDCAGVALSWNQDSFEPHPVSLNALCFHINSKDEAESFSLPVGGFPVSVSDALDSQCGIICTSKFFWMYASVKGSSSCVLQSGRASRIEYNSCGSNFFCKELPKVFSVLNVRDI